VRLTCFLLFPYILVSIFQASKRTQQTKIYVDKNDLIT
jgi:hypothetical protein